MVVSTLNCKVILVGGSGGVPAVKGFKQNLKLRVYIAWKFNYCATTYGLTLNKHYIRDG